MTTNPYVNFYTATNEQSLLESLIIESIKYFGFDTYYIKRDLEDFDEVFREATVSSYSTAYTIEVFLKSTMGFEGDGQFMSKFAGLEIRDEVTFTVSQSRFHTVSSMSRPREGDLIYLPLNRKVYEIKFVNHQDVFYQLGKLNVYDLQCELLEFSGEIFSTGIAEIDSINTTFPMDGNEVGVIEDWQDQSSEFQGETPDIIDFSEEDPFTQGGI